MTTQPKVEKAYKCHEVNNNSKFYKFIHSEEISKFIQDSLEKFKNAEYETPEAKIEAFRKHLNENIELRSPTKRKLNIRVSGSFDTFISLYPHWIIPKKAKIEVSKDAAEVAE
jgi:hypothetical protein